MISAGNLQSVRSTSSYPYKNHWRHRGIWFGSIVRLSFVYLSAKKSLARTSYPNAASDYLQNVRLCSQQLPPMLKAGLIIAICLAFLSGHTQNDSAKLSNDTVTSVSKEKSNNNTLKTIIYTTGYAGITLLCYRYLDTDIKNFAKSNQNKTITDIATTVEQLGTGTSNIIITVATGITSWSQKIKGFRRQQSY